MQLLCINFPYKIKSLDRTLALVECDLCWKGEVGAEVTMVKWGGCVCGVSCLCAFSGIPISPFFHFRKCFFSLVYIHTTVINTIFVICSMKSQDVQERLEDYDLSSYFIKPFQRVTKYKLFLSVSHRISVLVVICSIQLLSVLCSSVQSWCILLHTIYNITYLVCRLTHEPKSIATAIFHMDCEDACYVGGSMLCCASH